MNSRLPRALILASRRRRNCQNCSGRQEASEIASTTHPAVSAQARPLPDVDHVRYLLRLCELELIERERRMVERRIRAARFPAAKGLDSFEFAAIPSLNKMLVLELSRGEYLLRRENVIALGNSEPAS